MKSRIILFATVVSLFFPATAARAQEEDLTLPEAIGRSLENNYGIIISRADREVASINNHWGTAGRYPTIGFNLSDNITGDLGSPGYTNRLSGGVGLNWILFDGFRVNRTKARLESLKELAEGTLGVTVESAIQDVVLAYYNILLQKEQLQVLKTVMDLSADRYEYERRRQQLGGSVTYNVLQAQNVYLTDKANFLNQEVVVRNAVRNLNFLMGDEATRTWEFPEAFEADTSRYVLSDLLSKMTSSNQVLKNQYTHLLLSEQQTSLRESDYFPAVSVGAGMDYTHTWSGQNGTTSTGSGGFNPYGNLRISYDIYSAGVRKRSLEIARINEDIARVEVDQMEHALTNELFNLFDFYEVRIALLQVADENLQAAELNLSISEEKYRSGVINSFNYRDIQLIYLSAAVRRLQAVYNLITSRTRLTRLTGGFLGYIDE